MTSIVFPFSGYPAATLWKPHIFPGIAEILLTERLPVRDDKSGRMLVPVHRALKWDIQSISIAGLHDPNIDDAKRFVRGRFWPEIERHLYAEHLRRHGEHKAAGAYELMMDWRAS